MGLRIKETSETKQKNWSKDKAKRYESDLDAICTANLAGEFEIVIMDGCPELTNASIQVHTFIQWMDAERHVLASATPIFNVVEDQAGYMHFFRIKRC